MSDYPDPDEEFELMYGDELELLREQDEDYHPPSKSRKSLNFSTPSSSKDVSRQSDSNGQQNVNSFDDDFPLLLPATTDNLQSSTTLNVSEISHEPHTSFQVSSSQNIEQIIEADSSDSRKRTVDDLFGDINDLGDDILWENEPISKKPKLSEEEELHVLMKQIIRLRELNKEKHNLLSGINKNTTYSHIQHSKHNLSYRVPKYPFIGVKRHDGERIYVRFHSEEYEKEERQTIVKECSSKGLLGDGYKEIWKDAKTLITKQIKLAQEEIDQSTELSFDTKNDGSKQLWTDMYKPRKYIELLSDESTNRIMLKWLKLWDKAVFNRKPKVKPIRPAEKNKNWFFKEKELDTNMDEHGRPHHKVALLCGPPGLGKTTLAHVAAKHAGYNVVEVNASDDRSTEAFKTSLENATQMRSVVDKEKRPNCLVFDEIDGAPQASIDFLVKFISGNVTTKSKKGKGQKQAVLKRPIICICNDVYVPALRPLRQIAFVINFPPTSSVRLSERLMCISRREGIKTDMGAMMALAEKSNNDIRSCLSVLHFFKTHKKPVTLSDIYRTSIGQKDMQKGLFTVWQEIFQIERPKLRSVTDLNNISNKHTMQVRMSKILQTVCSFGDYDRLSQGIFENFPKLILKDSSMQGLSQAAEWFVFSDVLNNQIYSLQNYSLSTYLPYAFVVWHFTFAVPQSQKLNYPSIGYEAKQKETRQKAVVSEVLRGMPPHIRAYCHRLSLILDILPMISKIIVPPFRPVSLHLYTKDEKQGMLRVVNTMIDYNLNYVQERLPDGVYVYNLEPNIEDIVHFNKTSITKTTLSYSNKQMISREIELEKMRRFEVPKSAIETSKNPNAMKDKSSPKTPLPNHLQKLKARSVNAKPTVRKDFFGRVITSPTNNSGQGPTGPNLKNDIWYQYKEGYNNAVRKTIKIGNLK
ncbi:unnamed protein product [Phaedon cochleariae]|uniref:AAA+ ATPase domain-containing protein n=1 Tax=Phaedon cochleariae TaxID=80249 RepID=A0A9P0DGT2_PHACE|nr:unnamed protein product [Phaedon cochleariae]